LPHHPHHSSRSDNGSITLAKITGPPDRTTSDFYRRDSIDDYTPPSGSGTFSKIKEYELQEYQRAGGYERDRGVSEDLSSIGVGTKKRRRDSEKPLEEMDDRWVACSTWTRLELTTGLWQSPVHPVEPEKSVSLSTVSY